jgi:hypothetical protein
MQKPEPRILMNYTFKQALGQEIGFTDIEKSTLMGNNS